jgi:hypothetical protein
MKIVQILIKKVPPVNSEVLVHQKNIESLGCIGKIVSEQIFLHLKLSFCFVKS